MTFVREYTPDVFDSYKVLDWSEQIKLAVAKGAAINHYTELDMSSKLPFSAIIPFRSAIFEDHSPPLVI